MSKLDMVICKTKQFLNKLRDQSFESEKQEKENLELTKSTSEPKKT